MARRSCWVIWGLAALPVMEGKAMLFKEFGRVDAFPICLTPKTPTRSWRRWCDWLGSAHQPEDISAPRCFEIEERLRQR
jgi:malate dehydrogenase (oxaloacetate-decarboxylating)